MQRHDGGAGVPSLPQVEPSLPADAITRRGALVRLDKDGFAPVFAACTTEAPRLVSYVVRVGADGRADSVRLTNSTGIEECDHAIRRFLRGARGNRVRCATSLVAVTSRVISLYHRRSIAAGNLQ